MKSITQVLPLRMLKQAEQAKEEHRGKIDMEETCSMWDLLGNLLTSRSTESLPFRQIDSCGRHLRHRDSTEGGM